MGETLLFEKFQGSIDRRRLGRTAILAEGGDQVIGLHRLAGLQQELKHAPPPGGQFFLRLIAAPLGGVELVEHRAFRQVGIIVIMVAGVCVGHAL